MWLPHTPLFILLALAVSLQVSATTYKCAQPDGKVSFQDQPCQGASNGSQITVKTTPPSASEEELQKIKAAATRDQEMAARRQQIENAEKIQQQNQNANETYKRQKRCEKARRALSVLKLNVRAYTRDEKGQKIYIPDSARQEEIAAAERAVAENCN